MATLRLAFTALFAATFLAFSTPGVWANEAGWKILQVVGDVSVGGEGLKPVAVRRNEMLPLGGWVQTGKTGRAVLVRGGDTMVVGPGSRVNLPSERVDGNTQVWQSLGSVFYSINKQTKPHFQVDTPYLAAVVKGTSFVISVADERARIDVTDGLVQVSDPGKLAVEFVRPGFSATVARGERDGAAPSVEVVETKALPALPVPAVTDQAPARTDGSLDASAPEEKVEATAPADETAVNSADAGSTSETSIRRPSIGSPAKVAAISDVIGERRVDIGELSGGLATDRADGVIMAASAAPSQMSRSD